MRVFWPKNCLDNIPFEEKCWLVGWNNAKGDIVIVTALPYIDAGILSLLLAHDRLLDSPQNAETLKQSNGWAINSNCKAQVSRTASQLYSRFNEKRLSIIASTTRRKHCNSVNIDFEPAHFETSQSSSAYLVIIYDPPDPRRMHYFSLERANIYEKKTETTEFELKEELAYHTSPYPEMDDNWNLVIAQLNCAHDLQVTLRHNAAELFPKLRQEPSLFESYTNTTGSAKILSSLKVSARSTSFVQTRLRIIQLVMTVRSIFEYLLRLLETEFVNDLSLSTVFCTAQQIDLRLNQLCFLPHEYIAITRRSHHDWHWLTPDRNEAYIRFNNYLWLGINDLIIGGYLCSLLKAYSDEIETGINEVIEILCTQFVGITHWLMTWPAGLKLNTQLAHFMGEITIWIVTVWHSLLIELFSPGRLRSIIDFVAICGFVGGATLQVSLIIDIFAILSFHLCLLYKLFARVYFQQRSVLMSLFRVFRGLKYNSLRRRVDHGDYDVHQLLLGTILFTVVLFLLPTILAFYAVFTLARIIVLALIAVLCIILAFLNYFPLFPLLLRVKSPRRVPSGIIFRSNGSELHMKTKPMTLREIFEPFLDASSLFVEDIISLSVIQELFTGRSITIQQSKLYSSLYSMLPSRRSTPQTLYFELRSYAGIFEASTSNKNQE